MAKTYGTVTTFTAGSVLTAAQLNVASTAVNNLVLPSAAKARVTGNKALTSGNAVSWDAISAPGYDTDTMWSAGSPTRLTLNTPGIYIVVYNAYVLVTSTSSTLRTASIYLNGSTTAAQGVWDTVTTAGYSMSVSAMINSTTGTDYVEAFHSFTGGTHTLQTDARSFFAATWIGRAS